MLRLCVCVCVCFGVHASVHLARRTFLISRASGFSTVSLDCYRRELANPRWKDINAGMSLLTLLAIFIYIFAFAGMYSMLCTIEIDLSKLGHSLGRHPCRDDKAYYKAKFEIALLFGLRAQRAAVLGR